MEPRISIITLGVEDLVRSRRFYEDGLGWPVASAKGDIVFIQLSGLVLALYPRHALAEDAGVPADRGSFGGFTLAHNVREKADVAAVLETAAQAGATVVKPAQDVFWGGHSGYFADPDGNLWEVAWNPFLRLNERGELVL